MPATHAILSASGASRWLACPPSVRLEEQFPRTTSEYAAEGTAAHELCEMKALRTEGSISERAFKRRYKAFTENSPFFNAEMEECSDAYVALIKSRLELPDTYLLGVEEKLDFSAYVPDGFGTADCAIISGDTLEIIDFKYGKGVPVSAENNAQMQLYALGAFLKFHFLDIENIRMTIFQPRLSHEPSTSVIPLGELLDWAEHYVRPRALLAFEGKGEFAPSEKTCRFCRAKQQCRARAEQNLKLFDDSPDPQLISPDEAGEILEKAGDIKAWLEDIKDFVTASLMDRKPVAGWKLVEGKSNRKYKDEHEVVKAMCSAGYDRSLLFESKLLTLTAMEKAFGKKVVSETLGDLIVKPKGAPTLAPASSEKPEYIFEEELLQKFDD